MTLINTDGMALIGPGSEWFWTALSGLVLAITFLAIYRQLRLQRSQGAIDQIDAFSREWGSERLLSYRLSLVLALQAGVDPANVPDAAAGTLGNYWEGIGALARAGHLDRTLLWDNHGNACQLWWAYLSAYTRAVRTRTQDPGIYEHFEWLANRMDAMDRRAGIGVSYDGASIASMVDRDVINTRERLRVEQSLRTVIIATPESMPEAPLAPTAAAEPVTAAGASAGS